MRKRLSVGRLTNRIRKSVAETDRPVDLPTERLSDGAVDRLILAAARVRQHIIVVTLVTDILVLWYEVDVHDADVDTQTGLAVPQ